jgi:hypothetical protein
MACITVFAPMAMATTELTRVIQYEDASTRQFDGRVERKALSMSWVVVTDSAGKRRLQMEWAPSPDLR